jgi:ERCC4-type nuclease
MKLEAQPIIQIDNREQLPLVFTRLASIRGTLQSGDYSIAGCEESFAVERKSIADLVGCCTGDNRERFERELHRLRGFQFKRLVIVGTRADIEQRRYVSKIAPASVLGSLAAWEVRYDCPVVWADTPEAAAVLIERWAHYFTRELLKRAEGITQQNP